MSSPEKPRSRFSEARYCSILTIIRHFETFTGMTQESEVKILFEPSGRSVFAIPGTILIDAAARAGCVINTPCGGSGSCGKCTVRITKPSNSPVTDNEIKVIGREKTDKGFRLACSFRITTAMTVEVPDSSLFQSAQKILSSHSTEKMHLRPAAAIHEIVRDPDQDECTSISESIARTLPNITLTPKAKTQLAAMPDFSKAVLVTSGDTGILVSQTRPRLTGVAFDIGTTTIVGTLVDLETGADLALASSINPQTAYGDDVISRIQKCRDTPEGLSILSKAIRDCVNGLISEMCRKSGISQNCIFYAVFAGNTAMQQIFAGIDPSGLGEIPFEPAFKDVLIRTSSEAGINIAEDAEILVFPQIGGFVGGDTVSGMLATRIDQALKPSLMVDVGTNGEIVLSANGRLLSASVAAGPAFEGARIIQGMRATSGAIEKVVFLNDDIDLNVIGNAKPAGICGTGLIDAAAIMLRLGVLDITGRILDQDELPEDLPDAIRQRIVAGANGCDFVLAPASITASGEDIRIHQRDIRELQLANAAIRAGINILLKTAGVSAEELDTVLLAGAFGNFIRRNNARRIGMLPQIPCDRIRFVGNTASFGAKRVLLSLEEADYASDIMRRTEHVDLSRDIQFQDEFGEAMIFPDCDIDQHC